MTLPHPPRTTSAEVDNRIDEVWICASPKAGRGQGRQEIDLLVKRLRGDAIDVHVTHSMGALRDRIADHSRSTRRFAVVAAGGDGTLALVAQNLPREIPIVPLPMGTENLLARHFGYTCSAEAVGNSIQRNKPLVIDAGLANGRLFLVMVTAGMDAEVVRGMHLTRRGHITRWSYARPILRALSKYGYPTITSRETAGEGETYTRSACWMMAFNLPCYGGGLNIEPGANGTDGMLDRISLHKGLLWNGLHYLTRIKLGWHLRHRDVDRRRFRTAIWSSPLRVPYQLDGDYAGRLPVEIEVLPGRVTLLAPPIVN
ncbi:diacylglycerol/lipid kinase family protein [Allorhodopirellula heiligendammensis]|uniref:Diacylglycerol kinase n=1 Tax=Allorhodopirellula heiligendammensis TaxID=2714739 RepID=A0A5C6BXA7_9BACT|nr:diacylglycerol kinase family protein [Allorhodopirellula heiligendammensis]TWU16508.1 Diacylglycerol kinase [Allorhodopirellula heiligendammensis]